MRRLRRSIHVTASLVALVTLVACPGASGLVDEGRRGGDGSGEGSGDRPAEDGRRRAAAASSEAHEGSEHSGEHGGEEEHHEDDIVRLSEKAVSRIGLRVAPVVPGGVEVSIDVPAEVQLNPDRVAHITSLVSGQLREVRVTTGDRVEAGQVLAVLRSVDLGLARAEYQRARAMLEVANANFTRQKRLRSDGIASERSFLEAQLEVSKTRAELDAATARLQVFGVRGGRGPDLQLRAPIAGVVIARHATQGENVDPEDRLFIVADLSTVWVIGRVYEQYVAAVRPGMAATLVLRAFPGRTWAGTVSYVASTLDEETRSLAVRVEMDNPDGTLRPGLFGTLALRREGSDAEAVPVVPDGAVQNLRGRPVVFVPAGEENTFRAVPVVTGTRSSGRVEILEGLGPDARVVVEGAFVLKSHLLRSELGDAD